MSWLANPDALPWLAWAVRLTFGAALAAGLLKRRPLARGLGRLAAAVAGLAVLAVCWPAQRPPLPGPYETTMQTVFLLGVLAAWAEGGRRPPSAVPLWCRGFCLALLAVLWFLPQRLTPDSFMFDYLWMILFFQLRLVAMALLLFAAACYLAGWRPEAPGARRDLRRGRAFLLAGWSAFLGSEYCGATWSYYWLGDFWGWSAGFLESTLLFLAIAVPLHLPPAWRAERRVVIAAGAGPGLVVVIVTLVHQVGLS